MALTPAQAANVNAEFQARLEAAVAAAEAATGAKTQVNSTFRTREDQAQSYANYQLYSNGAKSWTDPQSGKTYTAQHPTTLAAYPGNSYHEKGQAADIQPGPVLDWLHKNAGQYGLEFLQGSAFKADPIHIQLSSSQPTVSIPPVGTVQVASTMPPIPQPRPQNPMQVAANQWANPTLPVLPTLPGSPQPSTPMPPPGNALALAATPAASPAAAAIQNVALAPPATISGLQPGGIALSSDGASPLQKVQFNANSPVESTTVPKGPYEIENIIKAAMKGDEGALRWATMVSSLQAGMAGGEPVAKPLLEKYFADLAASSPGAIRAVETALGKNPGLTKAIAGPLGDALLPMLPEAFRQLPLTQVPNPNSRPQTGGVLPPPTGALAYAPPATGGALPAPNALKQQAADYLKKFSWTSPGLVNSTSRYWEANPDLAPKGVASNPQAPSVSTPLPPPAQPATEFPQQTFGSNNGYLTGTQDEGVGGGQSTSSYWAPAPQQPAAPSSTTYYTASGAPVSVPSNNSTYAASTGFGTVPSNALSGVSNRASGSVGSNNTYLSGQGQSASPLGWTSPQAPVGSGAGLTAAQNAFSSPYGWTSSASNALSQAVAMAPVKPQATASSWTPWKSTTSVPATVPGANVNRPGVATTSKAGPTPQSVAPQPAATPRATAQSYAQSDPNWANMNSSQQTNATNSYLNWNGPEQTSDPYAAGWFPEDYQDLPDLDANSTNIFGT